MYSGECWNGRFINYTQCFNRSVKLFTRREDIDGVRNLKAANLGDVGL